MKSAKTKNLLKAQCVKFSNILWQENIRQINTYMYLSCSLISDFHLEILLLGQELKKEKSKLIKTTKV